MTTEATDSYRTTELELAAFLKANGNRLLNAKPQGSIVAFEFDPSASSDAEAYIAGASLPARELFEAHRSLRALIQQVREHTNQRKGSESIWKNRNS